MAASAVTPLLRFYNLLKLERDEIITIYIYSAFQGLLYLSLPLGIQAIINLLFGGLISTSIIVLVVIVVGGVVAAGAMQVMQMVVNERIQRRIFTRFALQFANKIPRLDLEAVDNYYLPELVNRFFDTPTLQKGVTKVLLDFPSATVQIFFGLTLLSFYNPAFIFLGIGLTLLLGLIFRATYPRGIRTSLEESNYKYEVGYWLEEVARSVATFKFMSRQEYPMRRADKLISKYLDARAEHFKVLKLQYWAFVVFKVIITASLLTLGSVLVIQQQINLGQFIAAEIVILLLINSIEKLISSLDIVYDMLTSLEKLNVLLDKPVENDTADEMGLSTVRKPMKIELNNVSYRFNDDDRWVLKNLNLTINPGERICIFGTQGSGKSSLLKLLTGAYGSYSGQLLYDGFPLGNHNPNAFRKRLGIFVSGSDVFSGSLYDNLTLGDNTVTEEEVLQATQWTGLLNYIRKQKNGLLTHIDTLGKKLPRNTVNKIILSRILLAKPDLILIEDAWHALEFREQLGIIQTLTDHHKPFTLVAVTNDENFARLCDKVVLLHEGEIVASGTFDEVSSHTYYQNTFKRFSL